MGTRLKHNDYTVGWVCALPIELTAAQEMLDEEDPDLPQLATDTNIYCLGRIGEHNVVLAGLPAGQTGIAPATAAAMQMKSTFPAIRFGLMVGIGGGVPSSAADIRLGDIVVSQPGKGHGGVIQYDFGKATPSGFETTGFLNAPPQILLAAVTKLRSNHDRGRSDLSPHLLKLNRLPKFSRDNTGVDALFEAGYNHVGEDSCVLCDNKKRVQRGERIEAIPVIHYGAIASGNQVMRDGTTRDRVSRHFGGVLCFEMEAAGLMINFPCLVIRGICDYADSHKNKPWQPFAAGAAAAYAKELLLVIPTIAVVKTQTADEAIRVHLPFPQNAQFVGRSLQLDILKQKLFDSMACQKIALVGLGGTGKTQIALQFAYWVKDNCPDVYIFWAPALSMETFEQACANITRALKIDQSSEGNEDVCKLVQQHLTAKATGKWLLIVDNADDINLMRGDEQTEGLLDLLPESDSGQILFTTRHNEVAQTVAGSNIIEVEKLERQEAMALLKTSLVSTRLLDDETLTASLLTELDCLPLALTQAAAYINTNKSSISEYAALLKNSEQDAIAIMSIEFADNARYKKSVNAVARTWIISFNQIRSRDNNATKLLEFISCIEWKAIPYSILPAVRSQAELSIAIGTLCSYSFLERRDERKLFDMHRLVHLATRTWIRQSGHELEINRAALKHLSEVFPFDYTHGWTWQDYIPHAVRIETNNQYHDTEEKSKLFVKMGWCLHMDRRIREAVFWLQKSCAWRDKNLSEDHPDWLVSQHVLASAYEANGQIKEAVSLLEHVVAIEAQVLAEDHPSRLTSQHELARAYQANGKVKEAVSLLEHVVGIEAKVLVEEYPDRLASQHELARAYQAKGQIEKAVLLLENVVVIGAKVLAEDHPLLLASQHELAIVYQSHGQVKEAVLLLKHVVAMRAKVLAEDHPDRMLSERMLACFYEELSTVSESVQASAYRTRHPVYMYENRLQFGLAREIPQSVPHTEAHSLRYETTLPSQELKLDSSWRRKPVRKKVRGRIGKDRAQR